MVTVRIAGASPGRRFQPEQRELCTRCRSMCRRVTQPRRTHDARAAATALACARCTVLSFTELLFTDLNIHLATLGRAACPQLAGTAGTRQVVTRSTPSRTRVAGQQAGAAR